MISAHIKARLKAGTKLNVIVINQTNMENELENKIKDAIESCYYWDYIQLSGYDDEEPVRCFDSDLAVEKVMTIIKGLNPAHSPQ